MIAKINLEFNLQQAYDKMAYSILKAQPDESRKDYLVSALLYYSKSPSFTLELLMKELIEKLSSVKVEADAELKATLKKIVDMGVAVGSVPPAEKFVSGEESDGMDDVFKKLSEDSIV